MKLSIIIVSYNTSNLTINCIKSIKRFSPSFEYEIIVVDNASADSSVQDLNKLAKEIKNLQIISNSENLGFSKANNMGIKKANGEYIFLLNSDTEIKSKIFEKMIEKAQSLEKAGVVAPQLRNVYGSVQNSIYRLPTIWRAIRQYYFKEKGILDKYSIKNGSDVEVESVVGAAFLITPEALKKVGMLDEKYFMYFEDLDYCRSVRNNGLKVYYVPELSLVHIHGASGKNGVNNLLIESSKKYFGIVRYYFYTFILWSGQKIS